MATLNVLRVPHDVRETDALNPVDVLEIDVPHLVAVRVLQTLHKERPIRVAHEQRPDRALVVRQHVHSKRVRRRLHDRIRVLAQARVRRVREPRLRPRLRVHRHVEEHFARRAVRVILHRHDRELGHDRERDDPPRVLPGAKILHLLLRLEEVR